MKKTAKLFISYVIPSVFSFTLAGLYCFVDAFFVGNRVGDRGIAAINIAFSILALIQAVGTAIGIGASVKYTVYDAQGKTFESLSYLGTANALMLVTGIIVALPLLIFPETVMHLLGANDNIAQIGIPYIRIFACFAWCQIFGTGFEPIARNCNGSIVAMASMIFGLVSNIVLDWLFVWIFNLGLPGAAWASVIAQFISMFIPLIFLYRNKKLIIKINDKNMIKNIKDIVSVGISPFGLIMIPNVSIIFLNRATLRYGGEEALAAYGCIAYIVYIILLVIQGIDDGAQPIVSRYHGIGDNESMKEIKKLTTVTAVLTALVFAAICFTSGKAYGHFMGSSDSVCNIIDNGMRIFMIGIPFASVSRTIASNLYASECNKRSYIISYGEPVFIIFFLLFLPSFFGQTGVWLSNTIGQFCLMILSILLVLKVKNQ